MPGKNFEIPGVGQATIYKRRGMRNIRISISRSGKVRVNLPKWAPYITAERFAMRNRAWIEQQLANRQQVLIKDGDIIGRGAVVKFEKTDNQRTFAKVSSNEILIRSPLHHDSDEFQSRAIVAAEKALKMQAEAHLIVRTKELARQHGFKYGHTTVKRLTSRWGSCSQHKNISLSFFLMQLPDKLIDYVILHELSHTEQMNHSPKFWARLEKALPNAKEIRKQMRNYQPHLSGRATSANIDNADLPLR